MTSIEITFPKDMVEVSSLNTGDFFLVGTNVYNEQDEKVVYSRALCMKLPQNIYEPSAKLCCWNFETKHYENVPKNQKVRLLPKVSITFPVEEGQT